MSIGNLRWAQWSRNLKCEAYIHYRIKVSTLLLPYLCLPLHPVGLRSQCKRPSWISLRDLAKKYARSLVKFEFLIKIRGKKN